jgi:beta-1,4-mannosyltransferase
MAPPRSRPLRVLSIPAEHSYVERCRPDGVSGVRPEAHRRGGTTSWSPSPALEPAWLAAHRGEFDVVHLHFGFDHLTPDDVRDWIEALRDLRVPLVFTVHDLRNPHHDSPERHDAHLDLLVPAAAAVITLTRSAADVIDRRWGRTATVIPHPHVAELGDRIELGEPGGRLLGEDAGARPVAGIHLKDLRRNVVEPSRLVAAAAWGAQAAGGRLRVDLHPGVIDRPELAGVRQLAAAGEIDLRPHPRFDDRALIDYLTGLDVSVLPYRFGTHSGWLEACRDVGTRVVAPSCGFYGDQWSETVIYRADEEAGLDESSLADAVREALLMPAPAISSQARLAEAAAVRDQHAHLYGQLYGQLSAALDVDGTPAAGWAAPGAGTRVPA